MNNHQPPPPGLNSHTTAQVLRQTRSIFWSHLLTFIFLSFLILTFHSNVENGTHFLTPFIDKDPSMRSLLSRLDIPSKPPLKPLSHARRLPPPHRVNLDDFFSGDEDNTRSLFGSHPKTPANGSFLILSNPKLGFSNYVTDNGIRVSQIVRSPLSFQFPETSLKESIHEDNNSNDESNLGSVMFFEE
ncbi:hypothetical protein LOK49_LG12G00326 [Camellia lanceoleosa]|uniref:Uncharacterized protein n=1 Tax=Camellia lanceoleosa TaxID=1840588 RepID=A0ACC0FXT0_9ERIC|nr:hypothetical protein LOK49_LG12G00326 [Camellia lanceoleosa]